MTSGTKSTSTTHDEAAFLDQVQETYRGKDAYYRNWIKDINVEVFRAYLKGGALLELGCAWGESTARYAPLVERIVSVEGSAAFIEEARKRVTAPNVEFVHLLFEEISYQQEFDYVEANYVLEHVADVADILGKCRDSLKPGGLLLATVPNAKAFSRQLAVEMGLMESVYELTENDNRHGHRRVYDADQFRAEVQEAGFTILESGGLFIKPFADFQVERMIDSGIIGQEQLTGLFKMAKRYPEIAGGIYVVGRK